MISDKELTFDYECPFFTLCGLPKIQFLCKIPNCKNCPDYMSKLAEIRKFKIC